MGKISKTGIAPHQQIKAEHITRIIDALSGETPDTDIQISGSLQIGTLLPNVPFSVNVSNVGTSAFF